MDPMQTRAGSTLNPRGMLVAKTEQEFIKDLKQGMENWRQHCLTHYPEITDQLNFLKRKHSHVIFHVGTHGQISVELFNRTGAAITNPTRTLDTGNGTEGAIVHQDGPARFERFELPPGVENFRLHEGAIAPGVCFSDEEISFKNLMTALTRKNKAGMVKNIDPDPKNWSKSDDYEINLSHELMPHTAGFYMHHWKERHYTPQSQALAPGVERKNYPIVKRFITTVNELKKSDIRLFEWHVVAFMIYHGVFFVIDLNPYLFAEEIKMAHLRSGVEEPRDETRPKSDVEYRDDINVYLHAVTNTAKIVALFSQTTNLTCIDSTCSVLRFKVHDGPGINGALSNIREGSYDGVIDSYDIRRKKLMLKDMLESDDIRSKIQTITYRRNINALISEIRNWYEDKHIFVPHVNARELVVERDSSADALNIINLLLTNINYESIWIRPIKYGNAMEYLIAEIGEYMGQIIPIKNELEHFMNWLIFSQLRSRVRTSVAGPIQRYGFPGKTESDEVYSPKSPLASLDKPANASHFTKLRETNPDIFRDRASRARPYGGGKIKKSNKKQHNKYKKYKNTRKGRRRTNKNKKKRANKTNKKRKQIG
jgi:hypothetical protein